MNDRDCESCKKFSRIDPQEGDDCKMHEFTLHSATKYDDGTPIMSEPETDVNSLYPKSIVKESNQLNGWISVKDKLPNAQQNVIVCTDINTVTIAWINGDHWVFADTGNGHLENWSFDDVKYWMPMPEPPKDRFGIDFCEPDCCPYWDKYCDHTLQDKHMCPYLPHDTDSNLKYFEQAFTEFAKTQDDLIEEYDATFKVHGDTLEEHLNRICVLEHLYEEVIDYVCELREKVDKIAESLTKHKGSDFCGNCTHAKSKNGVYTCKLLGGNINPDNSSCSMFEPPF